MARGCTTGRRRAGGRSVMLGASVLPFVYHLQYLNTVTDTFSQRRCSLMAVSCFRRIMCADTLHTPFRNILRNMTMHSSASDQPSVGRAGRTSDPWRPDLTTYRICPWRLGAKYHTHVWININTYLYMSYIQEVFKSKRDFYLCLFLYISLFPAASQELLLTARTC